MRPRSLILERIMSLRKTTSILLLFAILTILAAGCGRTEQDPNIDSQKIDLEAIYEIYSAHVKNHQRPPASSSDLKQYERGYPVLSRVLREGKYVIVWGVNDQDAGTILAYEKDAPTNGGRAVMADGKVKRLDAEAFRVVPKTQP
jgi:hypothetical protein